MENILFLFHILELWSYHVLSAQGQAVDELGMICASLAFLYVVLEVGHLDAGRCEHVGKVTEKLRNCPTCAVLACGPVEHVVFLCISSERWA